MEITFLGTSSGVPTKSRNVSATAVKKRGKKTWCLVDCGEGTQHQIQHTPLSLNHLSVIMITHVHGDHCFGLPGLLASAAMAGRKEPLMVVAPAAIKRFIETSQQITDTFLSFEIDFVTSESLSSPIELSDFIIEAWPLSHRVASQAFVFQERHTELRLDKAKLTSAGIVPGPVWGQLQKGDDVVLADGSLIKCVNYLLPSREPRKVIVGGDNDSPELLEQAALGVDLLIHEATFTEPVASKVGPGPQHSTAKKVAQFAHKLRLKNLILTHFSARYQADNSQGTCITEIEHEARSEYSGCLYLANDLDRFYLDKTGVLRLESQKSL